MMHRTGDGYGLNVGDLREFLAKKLTEYAELRPVVALKIIGQKEDDGTEHVNLVESWPITKGVTIDVLTNTIRGVATREARGGGSGRFAKFGVFIFHNEAREHHAARYTFQLPRPAIEDGNSDFTDVEPPTQRGFLAQVMRHKEEEHRQSSGDMQYAASILREENESLRARVQHLEAERVDMIVKVEAALTQKEEREIMRQEAEARQIRMKQILDLVMMLGPTIVNRIAGKMLIPERVDTRVEMLRSFMASLNEHQYEMMSKIFTKEQMIVVLEMYQQFMSEEKEKEEKDRKAAGIRTRDATQDYQQKQAEASAAE